MPTYLRSQTTIPSTGSNPGNMVVWNFHWKNVEATANRNTDATTIHNRINALLVAMTPQSATVTYAFPDYMNVVQAHTEVYDLEETKPRVAIRSATHTVALNTNTVFPHLPPEVAICVSYQSTRVSGMAQNRRRGRIYVGPLCYPDNAPAFPDQSVPSTARCDALVTSFRTLLQPGTAAQPRFCVLSRQTWGGLDVGELPPIDPNTGERVFPEIPSLLPDALNNVVEFWSDNAWDTQRRRGIPATTRSSQVVP